MSHNAENNINTLTLAHTHTHSPYSHPGTKISASFHHSSGSEQQFSEGGYTIAPGDLDEDQLSYDPENGQERFPIAILMESDGIDGRTLL